MPFYQIERNISGWSSEDLDAAAIRTQTCAAWFEGMAWIRSYYAEDTGTLTCYYRAGSPQDLERHALAAEVPCDRIVEVVEVLPLGHEPMPPQAAQPRAEGAT